MDRNPISGSQKFAQCAETDIGNENESILECLKHLCLSQEMADITFTFQDQMPNRIPAHKMILSMRSEVFKYLFYDLHAPIDTFEVKDITPMTFQHMLRFIYADQIEMTNASSIKLLHAADKYKINALADVCESYLKTQLSTSSVCIIYRHAKHLMRNKLKANALSFIEMDAKSVFKDKNFLSLSKENLTDILKMDSLHISEIDIFRAVLKWVEAKMSKETFTNARMWLLPDILYMIALPSLSLEDFTKTVVPSGVLSDEEQLSLFKAITMKQIDDSNLFRTQPRIIRDMLRISLADIFPQRQNNWMSTKPIVDSVANYTFEIINITPQKRIRIMSAEVNLQSHTRFQFQKKQPITISCTVKGHTYEGVCDRNGLCSMVLDVDIETNETRNLVFEIIQDDPFQYDPDVNYHMKMNPYIKKADSFVEQRRNVVTYHSGRRVCSSKMRQGRKERLNTMNGKKYFIPQNGTSIDISFDGPPIVTVFEIYVMD